MKTMSNLKPESVKSSKSTDFKQTDYLKLLRKMLQYAPAEKRWVYEFSIQQVVEHIASGGDAFDKQSMSCFRTAMYCIHTCFNKQKFNARTITLEQLFDLAREEYESYEQRGN